MSRHLLLSLAFGGLCLTAQAAPTWIATDLGGLGGANTVAQGLNDKGEVVGWSNRAGGGVYAFRWANGQMQEVNGLAGYDARFINNAGQIAGQRYLQGGEQGFLFSNGQTQNIGTLGGNQTILTGMNASGELVGRSVNAQGQTNAVRYSAGTLQGLGTLGGGYSDGFAINTAGLVTGLADTGAGASHAFLHGQSGMTDIEGLGSWISVGRAINDAGQVTGYAGNWGPAKAFLYQNGTMQSLGTLGGNNSFGLDINASGQVVGSSDVAVGGARHAFLYSQGQMVDLGTLGGTSSEAVEINNRGEVLGWARTATQERDPFLWFDGVMTNLGDLVAPFGIGEVLHVSLSEFGVAGYGRDGSGNYRSFLLHQQAEPTGHVPEPAGFALAALGLLACMRRRR